jgi:hypothetical protein
MINHWYTRTVVHGRVRLAAAAAAPAALSRRVIDLTISTTTTTIQIRSFIPPAYRNRQRLILVKPTKRVGGGGREHRLRKLVLDDSNPRTTTPKNRQESVPATSNAAAVITKFMDEVAAVEANNDHHEMHQRISIEQVEHLQLQKLNLLKMVQDYRNLLLILDYNSEENLKPIKKAEISEDTSTSLTEWLRKVQKQEDGTTLVPATMQSLCHSEDVFRQLCQLLRDMILQWARQASTLNDDFSISRLRYLSGEDPQRVAEELLLALAAMRSDRAALVESVIKAASAQQQQEQQPSVMKHLGSLVGKMLGLPSSLAKKEDTETKEPDMQLLAHSDPKYGPQKEHLQAVFRNIAATHHTERNSNGSSERSAKKHDADAAAKATRMTLLLEQSTADHQFTVDPTVVDLLLQTWSNVGTLQAAQEAERLFVKYDGSKDWNSHLLIVLRAFRNAALTESTNETRLEAVTRAKEILKQTLRTSPRLLHPASQRLRKDAFITLLETFQNAGTEVLPGMGREAQELMKLFMDNKSFSQLEGNDKVLLMGSKLMKPPFVPELDLVDSLVQTYAMTNNREFVIRAVRLLNLVLDARKRREWKGLVPTAQAVDGVVQSLIHLKRVWRDADEKRMAMYATELVDVLYSTDDQLPLPSTFQNILHLWEKSKANDAPDKAEELLSRLEIRAALHPSGPRMMDRSMYHTVLRCWREAARTRPEAAAKALQLLEKMEAQGSPYPSSLSLSPTMSDIVANVYNDSVKPNDGTYLLVLQTCFSTQGASHKEAALNIAMEVFSKMSERGMKPSESVVNTMVAGCKLLAPEDTEERAALARTSYEIARDSGLGRNKQVLRSILSTASSPPSVTTSSNNE